ARRSQPTALRYRDAECVLIFRKRDDWIMPYCAKLALRQTRPATDQPEAIIRIAQHPEHCRFMKALLAQEVLRSNEHPEFPVDRIVANIFEIHELAPLPRWKLRPMRLFFAARPRRGASRKSSSSHVME